MSEKSKKKSLSSRKSRNHLESSSSEALTSHPSSASGHQDGCRMCGKDNDHYKLLLCEMCNAEYHIYCLDPPLDRVPDGDFYCDNCEPLRMKSFCTDDTLDVQVAALPPEFTSRFGEVVWAHGGAGWGFWPSIVYDPRLTIGGARKLALKHVGKKHLVYFFGCSDAPFTVLNDPKLIPWEEGLLDEFDLGKTAKAMGKARSIMFEWALQAAMVEHEKPIEHRLDWNHEEDQLIVEGSQRQTRSSYTGSKETSGSHKRSVDDSSSVNGSSVEIATNKRSKPNTNPSSKDAQHRRSKTSKQAHNIEPSTTSVDNSNIQTREYFCRILLTDESDTSQLIGFVTLPKGQSTFSQLRTIISREIDDDSLPSNWKFSLEKLGPVSIKQEKKFGPLLGSLDENSGTNLNPLDVFIHGF